MTDFDSLSSVSEFIQRMQYLSHLQELLRTDTQGYLKSTGKTAFTIEIEIGQAGSTVNDLVIGRRGIYSGRALESLCKLLDREPLGEEIAAVSDGIPDRYLGLGTFPPEVIDTALSLVAFWRQYSSRTSVRQFAQAFGDQAMTVGDVIKMSRSGAAALLDPDTRAAINKILHDGLDDYQFGATKKGPNDKSQLISQLEKLIEQLTPRWPSRRSIAKAAGVPESTLSEAVIGKSSAARISQIIGSCERLLQASKVPTDDQERFQVLYTEMISLYGSQLRVAQALAMRTTKISKARKGVASGQDLRSLIKRFEVHLANVEPRESASSQPGPTQVLDAVNLSPRIPPGLSEIAGTTCSGVPFVLTEASFHELQGVPILAFRDSLITAIRMTRAQLNIGAQVQDDKERKILREAIGPELEELDLAIKTFTFAHPNHLLELHENQREVWKGKDLPRPSRKGRK